MQSPVLPVRSLMWTKNATRSSGEAGEEESHCDSYRADGCMLRSIMSSFWRASAQAARSDHGQNLPYNIVQRIAGLTSARISQFSGLHLSVALAVLIHAGAHESQLEHGSRVVETRSEYYVSRCNRRSEDPAVPSSPPASK